jgi:hypothetical protein
LAYEKKWTLHVEDQETTCVRDPRRTRHAPRRAKRENSKPRLLFANHRLGEGQARRKARVIAEQKAKKFVEAGAEVYAKA